MDERTPWLDAEAKSLGLQIAGKDDAGFRDIDGQKAETPEAGNLADGLTGELPRDSASDLAGAVAPEAPLATEPVAAAADAEERDSQDEATRAFQATELEPVSTAEQALSGLLSDLEAGDQSPDQPAAGPPESVVPPPEQFEASRDAAPDISAAPEAIESVSDADAPTTSADPLDDPDAAGPGAAPWDIAATATHAAHDDEPAKTVPPVPDDFGFDELEDGIASIFAALHAEGSATGEADDSDDGREPADDAVTFLLLGELDRLWHRPGR